MQTRAKVDELPRVDINQLLIQEFIAGRTLVRKHPRNSEDLARFIALLSSSEFWNLASGEIVGPIRVPGTPLITVSIDSYVGK